MSNELKVKVFLISNPAEPGYFIVCPLVSGGYSQGETKEEAMKMLFDALGLLAEVHEETYKILEPGDTLEEVQLTLSAQPV